MGQGWLQKWAWMAILAAVYQTEAIGQWVDEPSSQSLQLAPLSTEREAPVVTALVIAPGKQWFAAAGDDHSIRILDYRTGVQSQILEGHRDWVQCLAISANGRYIASAGNDGQVILWDSLNRFQARTIASLDQAIFSLAFDPEGRRIFCGGFGQGIQILSLESEQKGVTIAGSAKDVRTLDVSSDGKFLAYGGRDGKVCVFDLQKQELIVEQPLHRDRIRAIQFNADASIVTSVGEDRRFCRYDLLTGHSIVEEKLPSGKLMSVAIIDSVTTAVAGSDNHIHFFCGILNTDIGQIRGHRGSVRMMRGDAEELITTGYDTVIRKWNLAQVWDMLESAPAGIPVSSRPESSAPSFAK